MGERPILFSGAMVRALLAGTKTQTRRVVKSVELARGEARGVRVAPGTFCYLDFDGVPGLSWRPFGGSPTVPYPPEKVATACPYGAPGDRLWVRETWRPQRDNQCERIVYAADGAVAYENVPDDWHRPVAAERGNVPAIHMPRWASRLTLEVTGVRVERLCAISEFDAIAEGVEPMTVSLGRWRDYMPEREAPAQTHSSARESFLSLWESINGTESLARNPWVWVVEFRRVKP